jgi:hypothetical protein
LRNLVRTADDAPAVPGHKEEKHVLGIYTDSINQVDWQQCQHIGLANKTE